MVAESVCLESIFRGTAAYNERVGSTVTGVAFFKRLCDGVTIFPRCTPIEGLGRVLVTGAGATLDEHAQEVSEDRLVAAFDNSAAPSVLGLQARCGK